MESRVPWGAISRYLEASHTMIDWREYLHPQLNVCMLCGNTGVIDTTQSAISPRGVACGGRVACICPNGQALTEPLVECRSADGWSLHAPGSTDEDIASGDAPYLVSGTGQPTLDDYKAARAKLLAK